jgi:hypothetical protein
MAGAGELEHQLTDLTTTVARHEADIGNVIKGLESVQITLNDLGRDVFKAIREQGTQYSGQLTGIHNEIVGLKTVQAGAGKIEGKTVLGIMSVAGLWSGLLAGLILTIVTLSTGPSLHRLTEVEKRTSAMHMHIDAHSREITHNNEVNNLQDGQIEKVGSDSNINHQFLMMIINKKLRDDGEAAYDFPDFWPTTSRRFSPDDGRP